MSPLASLLATLLLSTVRADKPAVAPQYEPASSPSADSYGSPSAQPQTDSYGSPAAPATGESQETRG